MRGRDLDVLREAASAIRSEWGEVRGTGWTAVQSFYLAVADLLDSEAATQSELEPATALVNLAIEKGGGPIGYIRFAKDDDGQIQVRTDTTPASIAVARAFLGVTE